MRRMCAVVVATILLSVFGCFDIPEEQIICCDTSELVRSVKLVDKEGDWAKYIDFSKIRLFETYSNGDFLKDKKGNVYEEVKGLIEAKPVYKGEDKSTPTHLQLYLGHRLGYTQTGHFSLKINDSVFHKIAVKYEKKGVKFKIKNFKYQEDSVFSIKNGILEILIKESEPAPEPPVSTKCEDPKAINNGEELPCKYPPKCEDPNAINNGEELPCKYPPKCEDPDAINIGEELPCKYPPKCEDPNAINNGGELPCKYPRTLPPFETKGKVNLYDWMKHIDDHASISVLSIPGTHDSGARKSQEVNISKCQDLNFEGQLNSGIRFLDIRIDSKLDINHGGWYQYENLNGVIEICEKFLKAHPTETIIMSIKQEGSSSNNFADVVGRAINRKANLWYLGNRIPKMGEVRGKIILFRRYSGTSVGIPMSNWPDNRTFTSGDVTVQDWYDIGGLKDGYVSRKWDAVKALIDRAANREGGRLHVNFLSASGGIATPNQYAWGRGWSIIWGGGSSGVLNHFDSYQKNNLRGKIYGVIVMDYPSQDILIRLVSSNFLN